MEIRKASVSDMFGWLIGSFKLARKHWGAFLLAALVGQVIVLSAAGGAMGDIESIDRQKIALLYAAILLVTPILVLPFIAGWFVLTGKLANSQPASVGDLFAGYGDGALWKKLIVFFFIGAVLNIAVQGAYILVCMALGVGSDDISQFMTAQLSNDPEAMAGLSAGFKMAYCGMILIYSLLQTAFMLGLCQATLTDSDALDSVKTGIAATLKNLASLLVFILLMMMVAAMFIAVLIIPPINMSIAIDMVLVIFFLLFIVLLLSIFPLMLSFHYLFWRDVLGGGTKASAVSDSEVLI